MSDTIYSKPTESMKNLTEKVLKADLASRKNKMLSIRSTKFLQILWLPVAYYVVKVLKFIYLFEI